MCSGTIAKKVNACATSVVAGCTAAAKTMASNRLTHSNWMLFYTVERKTNPSTNQIDHLVKERKKERTPFLLNNKERKRKNSLLVFDTQRNLIPE